MELKMSTSVRSGAASTQKTAAVVVGVYEPRKLTSAADALDKAAKGALGALLRAGDMEGAGGKTALLRDLAGVLAPRVLLAGLGKEADYNEKAWREAYRAAVSVLRDLGAANAVIYLPLPASRGAAWAAREAALIAGELDYHYDLTKSKKDSKVVHLKDVALGFESVEDAKGAAPGAKAGNAIAAGVAAAKTLGNLPGNVCTPSYLGEEAKRLAKAGGFKAQVLDRAACEKLKMGSFLSVAAGSRQPPKFIVMDYRGAGKNDKPVVLVGKGITFDTGGISLKPGEGMDEMKFDMCGAAAVLGVFKAIAQLKPKVNLIGLIPTTENMPGGAATKPGDVVTSMSGQTIEILNTDAEGRLILCDALTYAERYEPQAVIDIATLTGACVIALGAVASGLFANDDALAAEVLQAGQATHDRAWHMPLFDEYQEQLKSNFADMANIGGRPAGSVTAACFLSRFTKKYKWAHLDIAGTAWKSGAAKGATGRPVPLLVEFVLGRAK